MVGVDKCKKSPLQPRGSAIITQLCGIPYTGSFAWGKLVCVVPTFRIKEREYPSEAMAIWSDNRQIQLGYGLCNFTGIIPVTAFTK